MKTLQCSGRLHAGGALGLLLVMAIGLTLAAPAGADVVTYQNGKSIRGLTRDLPDAPDQIEFTGARGTLRILRSRLESIKKEPVAMGWVAIGNEHREAGELAEAISAFRKALIAEPGHAEAQKMIDQTQADIAARDRMSRQDALKKIDDLASQARQKIQQGAFEEAEKLYQEANDLVPNPEQKLNLAKEISQMYLRWGEDRADKLDPPGAEDKFNKAVAADQDNSTAINQLLKLWEGKAEKRPQAAHIYETILERHPENTELRKKLGDLYGQMGRTEDQVRHYLVLYRQSDKWKGTALERQLTEGLNRLHRLHARQKDYDRAIKTYEVLASIDANTDPTAVIFYQYLKRANQLKPDDVKGRLELAKFAETNHLDQEATQKYKSLLESDTTRGEALAGLARYAQRALALAQMHFNNRNYSLARTLADQVRKDFPESTEVGEEAAKLIGKAQVEMANERRQQSEMAKDILKAAEEYYAQANYHFQSLFDTQRRSNPYLLSDREEAKKYFQLAIAAYQEALRINPELARNPSLMVNMRLLEARTRLAALNQSPTGGIGENMSLFTNPYIESN